MCGRFTLTSSEEQIAAVLPDLLIEEPPAPRYNIAPTQPIPAVLNENATRLTVIRWGLIPSWAKDATIGNRMINARSETVHEKPSFRRPLQRQRCLILADGFYEWKREPGGKTKTPYLIRLADGSPFAFAGLWDTWRSPEGESIQSGTILTTEPNDLMKSIHNRMPVILTPADCPTWLAKGDQPVEALLALLRPFPAADMCATAVSTRVNNPANDDEACIEPAG